MLTVLFASIGLNCAIFINGWYPSSCLQNCECQLGIIMVLQQNDLFGSTLIVEMLNVPDK